MATYALTVNGVTKTIQQEPNWEVMSQGEQPDTFRFYILSSDGSYRPTKGHEVIFTEDGNGLFGGLIRRFKENIRPNNNEGTPLLHEIEAVSFKAYAEYRHVTDTFASQTLKARAQAIVTDYLADFGVTLHGSQVDGPTIDADDVQNLNAMALLNRMGAMAGGYVWNIDADKKLRFTAPSATAAPYNIASTSNIEGDLVMESSEKDYANRVLYKIGESGVFERTVTFTGDGSTLAFDLPYPVVGNIDELDGTRGYLLENGVLTQLVAPGMVVSDANAWEIDKDTRLLTKVAGSAPAVGVLIVIAYDVQFPVTVTVDDAGEQASRGYVVERVIEDLALYDITIAETRAEQELDKAIAQARTARYSIGVSGVLAAGQTQTINVAKRNVNATFTLTQVRTYNRGKRVLRDVTASEGTTALVPVPRGVVVSWLGGGSASSSGPAAAAGMGGGVPGPPFLSRQFNRSGTFGGSQYMKVNAAETSEFTGDDIDIEDADYSMAIGEGHAIN
jgi:hypothetical protein